MFIQTQIKKTSKLRGTGLCVGNSPGPVNSPHKWPATRKMFPLDDVIMLTDGSDTLLEKQVLIPLIFSITMTHNERDGVSNYQRPDCLLKRLFRRSSKKKSKLSVTGLYAGNPSVTAEFRTQMSSNAGNISIWWRLHEQNKLCLTNTIRSIYTSRKIMHLCKRETVYHHNWLCFKTYSSYDEMDYK